MSDKVYSVGFYCKVAAFLLEKDGDGLYSIEGDDTLNDYLDQLDNIVSFYALMSTPTGGVDQNDNDNFENENGKNETDGTHEDNDNDDAGDKDKDHKTKRYNAIQHSKGKHKGKKESRSNEGDESGSTGSLSQNEIEHGVTFKTKLKDSLNEATKATLSRIRVITDLTNVALHAGDVTTAQRYKDAAMNKIIDALKIANDSQDKSLRNMTIF